MGGLNGAGWQAAKGWEIRASIRRHARSIRVAGPVEPDGQPIRLPQRYRPSDEFLDWHARRFGLG